MFVYQQLDGFLVITEQLFMYNHNTHNRNEYKENFHNNLRHREGLHSSSFISVPISTQRGKKPNVLNRSFKEGKQI